MERVREAPRPAEEEDSQDPSAPMFEVDAVPLLERLEALRQPGPTSDEVDAFLEALSTPIPPGEPPRVRADFMLDVLEDERLCELTGTDGRQVGVAALETILALGYPYALEVTPEMLKRARGARPRGIPRFMGIGLGLAVLNMLGQVGPWLSIHWPYLMDDVDFHHTAKHMEMDGIPVITWDGLLLGLMLLAVPVFSALAGLYALRPMKRFFNAVQLLVSGYCLLLAWRGFDNDYQDLGLSYLLTSLVSLATMLCLTLPHDQDP
ncbi:hypothetical protein JRI60_02035 [Archangium violaceum]|uniref:hypothetical protein n=1 Tax=Archangium violaceum TaxID=83451 RepID=UPI00194DD9E7|nr:hypothetical protein [Archangium violaceum]QRN97886.1 hypothetical protein JRI60_02035 [Archangium violaceum]